MENWLSASPLTLILTALSTLAIFAATIAITRISGLRTFAKMSSIDFATTIAIGSILAAVVMNSGQSLVKGIVALASIVGFQTIYSILQKRSTAFCKITTNQPLLLMRDGEFLQDNLKSANVSESDIYGKLREANAYRLSQVRAVVFEVTGDISVLHGDDEIDDAILEGVGGRSANSGGED